MARLFNVGHIAQLHEIQTARLRAGEPGIGKEVEGLIARLTSGGVAGKHTDEVTRIAKAMWDAGLAKHHHPDSFADYLDMIPSPPKELVVGDWSDFPLLVLVDYAAISGKKLSDLSHLFGVVQWDGGLRFNQCSVKGFVWLRCQNGNMHEHSTIRDVMLKESHERHMTIEEGLFLLVQHPGFLTSHFMAIGWPERNAEIYDGPEDDELIRWHMRIHAKGEWDGPPVLSWIGNQFRHDITGFNQGVATVFSP